MRQGEQLAMLERESARKSKQSVGNRSVENRMLGGSERGTRTPDPRIMIPIFQRYTVRHGSSYSPLSFCFP